MFYACVCSFCKIIIIHVVIQIIFGVIQFVSAMLCNKSLVSSLIMLIYINLCDVALLKIKFDILYIGVKLCGLLYFIFNIVIQIECHVLSNLSSVLNVHRPPCKKIWICFIRTKDWSGSYKIFTSTPYF